MESALIFVFTEIASTETYLILCAFIFLFLYARKGLRHATLFFSVFAALFVSTFVLKEYFQILRPENPLAIVPGYGFPSGHATGIMFLAIVIPTLPMRISKRVRSLIYFTAFLLVVAVGVSRVYLQVHTELQVLAGYILGALFALLWIQLSTMRIKV